MQKLRSGGYYTAILLTWRAQITLTEAFHAMRVSVQEQSARSRLEVFRRTSMPSGKADAAGDRQLSLRLI